MKRENVSRKWRIVCFVKIKSKVDREHRGEKCGEKIDQESKENMESKNIRDSRERKWVEKIAINQSKQSEKVNKESWERKQNEKVREKQSGKLE